MQERVQLAKGIADHLKKPFTSVEDWTPLLRFTQGNPLTITVVVGAALRKGIKTRAEVEDFVERLRKGESAFADEQSEGRSKSLGASLSYGFENAFTETERKQLALLHFFQGFVNVQVLSVMGNPQNDWALPELKGFTDEYGIALLDRAAEVGLLTAHGNGFYSIHPALPWYFRSLFEQYYSAEDEGRMTASRDGSVRPSSSVVRREAAARAFVEAMGELGNYYHDQYIDGNRDVIGVLGAEEANLLHARQIARVNGWWRCVISTMQGLRSLYDHTGRRAEWARLVNEIVPDFVDAATDGPLAGREEDWSLVTQYRVRLAREARQWAEAERLQRKQVEVTRQIAAPALAVPSEKLDNAQRNAIRTLAVSIDNLGDIQREQGKAECVKAYEEAIPLYQRIGDRPPEAVVAFNLGHAYKDIPALRNLAQAEHWYRRSLGLYDERDGLDRGKCYNQLGYVAWEQFKEARSAKKPTAELSSHLNKAVKLYLQGIEIFPPNAIDALAVAHSMLGTVYGDAGDFDRAIVYYREGIRYLESEGNLFNAAIIRRNVAVNLAQAGRLADAREYALAALRNFETFGERAAEEIERTNQVLAWIDQKAEGSKQ